MRHILLTSFQFTRNIINKSTIITLQLCQQFIIGSFAI